MTDYIGNYKNLRLHILPDIYPAGDEVVLIYETTSYLRWEIRWNGIQTLHCAIPTGPL